MRLSLGLACAAGLFGQTTPASLGLILSVTDAKREVRLTGSTPHLRLEAGESLHPLIDPTFSARWSGEIAILQAGDYRFETGAGGELRIDGRTVVNNIATVLSSGRHAIDIRFKRSSGVAVASLLWTGPKFDWEPVPGSVLSHAPTESTSLEIGLELVRELGCANCHAGPGLARPGPILDGIGSRTNAAWIHAWLSNPRAFRASAHMPVSLDARDLADATAWLATLASPPSPGPARRPNEVAIGKGGELIGTAGCIACHAEPGLELKGLGSKFSLRSLTEYLKSPSSVEPTGRMPSMDLNDEDAFAIAANLMLSRNPAFEQPPPAGDAARGRQVVEQSGCLACHRIAGSVWSPAKALPPLRTLRANRGCLSPNPGPGLPVFALGESQRAAISRFLDELAGVNQPAPAPIHELTLRLRELRCVACHQYESLGPAVSLAESALDLTGVGAKLKTAWLSRVVSGGARVRHGREIRMPTYPPEIGRSLAAAFAKAGGVEAGDGVPIRASAARERGLGLLGTNASKGGMGCIGCHGWGENKALGEEGPELATAAERLRPEWYRLWMRNPARIVSGTSMPGYFTAMPIERAQPIIDALWAGMELGATGPAPEGYRAADAGLGSEAKPVPGKEAIVIRWDMPEATPAAIAVGLPGALSYCFDAGQSRLLYAWRGGFLDMTGTLLRKTDRNKLSPTAEIIGEIFWKSASFPIRIGSPDAIPQRRFRGYRIVEGTPEFHYELDGIEVREKIVPARGSTALLRSFTIAKVDQPMWIEGRVVPKGTNVKFEIPVGEGTR